jgi:hypothetical protein
MKESLARETATFSILLTRAEITKGLLP